MDVAITFVSAYLLEYALSVDVVLALERLCDRLGIPKQQERRVRRWALATAIVARLVILTGATHLARTHTSASYVFGAMVLASSVMAYRWAAPDGPALWRCGRFTDLVSIVVAQVAFAADSIALVSVSHSTAVLLVASCVATITAHSVLPDVFEHLNAPRYALGTLLGLLGLKLLAQNHVHVPDTLVLVAITSLVAAAVVESLRR